MDENIAIACLGALNASTVGYLITRVLFSKNHSVLVATWLSSFCASFAVGLMTSILPGMTYERWVVLYCVLPVSFIGYHFGHAKDWPMSEYDRNWRLGFVLFVLAVGGYLGATRNRWIASLSNVFGLEANFAVNITILILMVVAGILLLMNDG